MVWRTLKIWSLLGKGVEYHKDERKCETTRDILGITILERLAVECTREGKHLWIRDSVVGHEAGSEGGGVVWQRRCVSTSGRARAAENDGPNPFEKPHCEVVSWCLRKDT